ncbi:YqaE/Pmp3 family membrane protein [Marivirga sp.]|uniref:YqaE/Pmp3 family membrane protein n=1 Tax=Marivirga sp. TaxID=2018662 RepID=UPI002D7F9963|nr:YqaE/Pmp3 family membrane protein [Marivirga sp.]HET8860065.1 YqaE/Pmp3 family membrane protein [Marivirga sp.]
MSFLQIFLAIFLPPLAVAMEKGLTSAFWINLILTCLFFIPGVIHAFYVLTK